MTLLIGRGLQKFVEALMIGSILARKSFSNTFEMVLKFEIDLKLGGSFGSRFDFLSKGVICAFL